MEMGTVVIIGAAISALVSLIGCFLTYVYTKKKTLSEVQSKQSEAQFMARQKSEEILLHKRLESYTEFWTQTALLSSEYLRRMTPDEAKATYDVLLKCYEKNGLYLAAKTVIAFQELRRVLKEFSQDEGGKDILKEVWRAKHNFRSLMKEDITITNEPDVPLEMGWWETPDFIKNAAQPANQNDGD